MTLNNNLLGLHNAVERLRKDVDDLRRRPTASFHAQQSTVVTIAGGEIDSYYVNLRLAPEGGTTDVLETINRGSDGKVIVLRVADPTYEITVANSGNIRLFGTGEDRLLTDPGDSIVLYFDEDSGHWHELGTRSLNDLNGVYVPSPSTGEVLTWTGVDWQAVAVTVSGNNLDDLADVQLTGPLADGEVLTYDSFSGFWVNEPAAGGGALDDLSDVTLTGVANDNILIYDSGTSQWINVPFSTLHDYSTLSGIPSDFPPSAHTHDWGDITGEPSEYPPEAHDHVIADITDWPSTFPPSAHTHVVADISDWPTTFPPSAHTHVIADISDWPSEFPPEAHTHDWADITGEPDFDTLYLQTDGGNYMTGNLGVGAAATHLISMSHATAPVFAIHKTAATAKSWYIASNAAATNAFSIGDESNYRFVISSTGFVGIAQTAPDAPLHVARGNAGTQPSWITDEVAIFGRNTSTGLNAAITILAGNAGSSQVRFADQDNAAIGYIAYPHNLNAMQFFTSGTERVRVHNGYNLIVGDVMAAPSGQIDVQMSTNAIIRSRSTGSGSYANVYAMNNGNDYVQIAARGTAEAGSTFGISNAGYTHIFSDGSLGTIIGTINNVPLIFGTNNAERLRIFGDGQIYTSAGTTPLPTLTGSTANPSGLVYAIQTGYWIKIGRVVLYTFRVDINTGGVAGTGDLRISLPFTAKNSSELQWQGPGTTSVGSFYNATVRVLPNTAYCTMVEGNSVLNWGSFATNGTFNGTVIYEATS